MCSSIASFNLRLIALPAVILVAALCLLRPFESRLSTLMAPAQGHGILGIMGGMRTLVAGGFWLRANRVWEERDAVATMACLKLTVSADDGPRYFWLNGARMIAYDFAAWRLERGMPAALRQQVAREQAQAALDFLEDGLQAHPDDPHLLGEMAHIRLRLLGDREGAARLFRQAAEQAGAPYYAARIHAELLVQLGRPVEALRWLKQILPELPANDPAARREVVVERIKALEAQVGVR